MGNDAFFSLCKKLVVDYFNEHADKTDNKQITENDVFIVWCCKTLQNNKALPFLMVCITKSPTTVIRVKSIWMSTKSGRTAPSQFNFRYHGQICPGYKYPVLQGNKCDNITTAEWLRKYKLNL